MTASWSSWVEGPRWAKVPEAIRSFAMELGVRVTMFHVEKRLIHETVFFTIEGEEIRVKVFEQALRKSLEEYNR